MRPHRLVTRREFLWGNLAAGAWLSLGIGCTSPLISRNQSPEAPLVDDFESKVRLVGDVSGAVGLNNVRVEGPALVVNLGLTGSDPPASPARDQLMADMLARNVANPNQILASPSTSLVWVTAYLPPAAEAGDPLDVEVRVPEGNETTDLSGGWMLEVRLKEMGIDYQGGIHTGHVLAKAEGPLLVDPDLGENDKSSKLRARILSGAKVAKSRNLGLMLKSNEKSVYLSKQIGDALNKRFHTYVQGTKRGVATPKNDESIDLLLHPRYKHNIPRYVKVVRAIPLREGASQRLQRMSLLESQLLDPVTAANAAIKLEAIGKDALPTLRKGIESKDLEVRFYSAEALAYLDDSHAAIPLAEAARDSSAFRVFALTALSTMDDIGAGDELKALLDSPSAETRYGAFRALWGMNPNDRVIAGKFLNDRVWLHEVASKSQPLVHVTRSFRPEVVLFGEPHSLIAPAALEAGKQIMVKVESDSQVVISRFSVEDDDKRMEVPNRLPDVIRAIVEMGGQYPDVVGFLHEAARRKVLTSRLEVDKMPQTGRRFDRKRSPEASDESIDEFEVGGAMPNLFGRRIGEPMLSTDSPAEQKTSEKAASSP